MTFSVVQTKAVFGGGPVTVTLDNPTTAGNVLLCVIYATDGRASATRSLTGSGTWTRLGGLSTGRDTNAGFCVYYKIADGTEVSVAVSDSSGSDTVRVYELGGLSVSPLDATYFHGSTDATLDMSATATGAGVAIAMAFDGHYSADDVTSWSGFSGYTYIYNGLTSGGHQAAIAYKEYLAAGPQNAYATFTPLAGGCLLLFKAAAGGGTTITLSDTGAGLDTLDGIAVALGLSDAGTGVDGVPGTSAGLALIDAGAGVDAMSAAASLSLSDTGAGTDAMTTAAWLAVSDAGAWADTLNLAVALQVADDGAGADLVNLITATLISLADTGSGADALGAVTVSLTLADAGAFLDATLINASLQLADSGAGADAIAVLSSTLIQILDAGAGADALSVAVAVPVSDAGAGQDLLAIKALVALVENATGADAVLRFDSAQRIFTITFTLAKRRAGFSFRTRKAVFTLN